MDLVHKGPNKHPSPAQLWTIFFLIVPILPYIMKRGENMNGELSQTKNKTWTLELCGQLFWTKSWHSSFMNSYMKRNQMLKLFIVNTATPTTPASPTAPIPHFLHLTFRLNNFPDMHTTILQLSQTPWSLEWSWFPTCVFSEQEQYIVIVLENTAPKRSYSDSKGRVKIRV